MYIPWQLCWAIGPLPSRRFPLASAIKAQPRGDFCKTILQPQMPVFTGLGIVADYISSHPVQPKTKQWVLALFSKQLQVHTMESLSWNGGEWRCALLHPKSAEIFWTKCGIFNTKTSFYEPATHEKTHMNSLFFFFLVAQGASAYTRIQLRCINAWGGPIGFWCTHCGRKYLNWYICV